MNASQANTLIRDFCRTNAGLHFVDLAGCLLQENGSPNPVLFLPDNLHLNAQGYKIWTQTLDPLLRQFAPGQTVAPVAAAAASSASAAPAAKQQAPSESIGPWFAPKSTRVFHRAGCSFVGRISKENLLEFATREQAAAGRRPCKTCNP
jgi:hypothetical protein